MGSMIGSGDDRECISAPPLRASLQTSVPSDGGASYQVVVHVDESVLSHDDDGSCELDEGSALAPETARRLACDASVVRNGGKTRTIPPAMRRALRSRDRGCRFPGCENRRFLDAHHVHHWARGGPTQMGNLLLLCRHHHRLVHEGGYRVDRHGRFYHPSGRRLPAVPSLPRGSPLELLERLESLRIDGTTCESGTGHPWISGTRSTLCSRSLGFRSKNRAGRLSNPESP